MMLSAALARLPGPEDEWQGRHNVGPCPQGGVSLAQLAKGGEVLDRLVALKQSQAKGGDARLGCAYLVGDLGWELGRVLAGLWLSGWHIGVADPAAIAVVPRQVDWHEDGESGTAHVLDVTLDPQGLREGGTSPLDLCRAIETLLCGPIDALARSTRLGPAAQWRLVGDGVAGALVVLGRSLDMMHEAVALGRAILGDRATRLHSRQTELVEIRLPHRPDVSDWFRLRGGCCRYYTARGESGEYCTTCVLRDRDDQIARLSKWLETSSDVAAESQTALQS